MRWVHRVWILVGVAVNLGAQGETGYDFLRLRYAPMSAHFGDGWVAAAPFVSSAQGINPAFSGGREFSAAVLSHVAGIRGGRILWAPEGAYALSASFLNSGAITKTNETGEEIGAFSVRFAAIEGSRRIWKSSDWAIGVGGKVAFVGVDDRSSVAVAADLGLGFQGPFYSAGVVLRNLGMEVKTMGADRFPLPLEVLAGAAFSLKDRLTGAVGFSWSLYAPASFSLGLLARLTPLLGVGVGFDTHRRGLVSGGGRDILAGFSAALSLRVQGFQLDYAYIPFGDPGDVHRVGLSRRFAP